MQTWLGFRGPQRTSFLVFCIFAKFRPASGHVSLGFGAPFWAPGGVFTARGLEKRKKPKNFESRAKQRHFSVSRAIFHAAKLFFTQQGYFSQKTKKEKNPITYKKNEKKESTLHSTISTVLTERLYFDEGYQECGGEIRALRAASLRMTQECT